MAIIVDGKAYPTIVDAAARLKVSKRTVGKYIETGVIPQPPLIQQGMREIQIFPDEYLQDAEKRLAEYRAKRQK